MEKTVETTEGTIVDLIKCFTRLELSIGCIELSNRSDLEDLSIYAYGIIRRCMKELKATIDDNYYNTVWESIGHEYGLGEWQKAMDGKENKYNEQEHHIKKIAKKTFGPYDYEKLRKEAWDQMGEER